MTTRYAAARTIEADPARVWALLTDAGGYPSWNPTVVSLDGRIAAGERIRLVAAVDPGRTFTLTVTEADAPRRLVWASGMPLGLFRGVRTYTLTPAGGGATAFAMEEVFSGPLAPLVTRLIPDLTDSFAEFADALRQAAENGR